MQSLPTYLSHYNIDVVKQIDYGYLSGILRHLFDG